jgi:hypothetical protein
MGEELPDLPDLTGAAEFESGWVPPEIDQTVAHPARIYDYLIGGKDHFDVDREAAEKALKVMPQVRGMARVNRAFLGRAVSMLSEAGIDQFLDIGTGIPSAGNTGEVARRTHPDARVVYVDYDPIVAAHSRALLAGSDESHTAVVLADVRDPKTILEAEAVRRVLDFDRPIAVLMVAVLHFVAPEEDPHGITARFVDAVAPGSALVVSHAAERTDAPGVFDQAREGWNNATSQLHLRTREEIAALLAGTEITEPGVVHIPTWRPDHELDAEELELTYGYCGVGFKSGGR